MDKRFDFIEQKNWRSFSKKFLNRTEIIHINR
jgi:hypothetical protein